MMQCKFAKFKKYIAKTENDTEEKKSKFEWQMGVSQYLGIHCTRDTITWNFVMEVWPGNAALTDHRSTNCFKEKNYMSSITFVTILYFVLTDDL